jgi:hypothetical protein
VVTKKQPQYINHLITYYLNIVNTGLNTSSHRRAVLPSTNEDYRVLRRPKSIYLQFIADFTTSPDEWQTSRRRLLQFLGSNQNTAASYNTSTILQRLEPFKFQLVPKLAILYGHHGRYEEVLRLLTHNLGGFNTAIVYYLSGGVSVFRETTDGNNGDVCAYTEAQQRFVYGIT